jgi:hypothetical protein
MKRTRPSFFLLGSLLICLFILSSCEKQQLKRNYTGNFTFTYIDKFEDAHPIVTTYDTVTVNGSISYMENYCLNISFNGMYFLVNVHDKELSLSSSCYSSPYLLYEESIDGHFNSEDDIEFVYTGHTNYPDTTTTTYTVHGTRY